jgi:cell division protein FtsI (penicillin-binding protein 3)
MANDGLWVAPRIVTPTTEPPSAPQLVAFHPVDQRRVISPLTAAQMRQMMQRVVLSPHGTGKKALLEGYSSAGKTGTAQKVDPATHAYSRTKYVASFAGFAPVNNPAITVVVILDSAVGLHQGGQVAAPAFQRIAQQVLEYLHIPHDVELPVSHQLLMAESRVKEQDLAEGSPDHLGESLEAADQGPLDSLPVPPPNSNSTQPEAGNGLVTAALREPEPAAPTSEREQPNMGNPKSEPAAPASLPASGSVILEVETGGIVVPSFLGKSVRAAVELAEQSGLDMDAVGSGMARQQSPPPGSHVAAGSRVTVNFER